MSARRIIILIAVFLFLGLIMQRVSLDKLVGIYAVTLLPIGYAWLAKKYNPMSWWMIVTFFLTMTIWIFSIGYIIVYV